MCTDIIIAVKHKHHQHVSSIINQSYHGHAKINYEEIQEDMDTMSILKGIHIKYDRDILLYSGSLYTNISLTELYHTHYGSMTPMTLLLSPISSSTKATSEKKPLVRSRYVYGISPSTKAHDPNKYVTFFKDQVDLLGSLVSKQIMKKYMFDKIYES